MGISVFRYMKSESIQRYTETYNAETRNESRLLESPRLEIYLLRLIQLLSEPEPPRQVLHNARITNSNDRISTIYSTTGSSSILVPLACYLWAHGREAF